MWEDEQIADLPSRAATIGSFYKGAWLLNANGAAALAWDPATNRWRSLDQIPQFAGPAAAAVAGDAFYLVGGIARMVPITTVLRYIETDCAAPPTPTSQPLPTSTPPIGSTCVDDCGGDGTVAVAELIRGVNVALGLQPLAECPAFDGNRDGMVAVNELIAAVNNALNGCA